MTNPTVIGDGLHVTGGVTSAEEARLTEAGLWARNSASNISVRNGVVWAGLTNLVVGSASVMTVTVKPLHFVASKASAEGIYRGCVKADTVVDVAAAPGSNSRIDVVWVMQQDFYATTSPDGATQGVVGVTTGTPAASPTRNAIPVGAVELATITVPALVSNTNACTIVQTAKWTAARGAPIPVANQADRDALTAYDGLTVWRIDGHRLERWTLDSSSWAAGWDDAESTYVPTWAAVSGSLSAGTGGSLLGYYQRRGSRVALRIALTVGTSGFNGGLGAWTFTAPIAATVRSYLTVKAWVPAAGNAGNPVSQNFLGFAYIDAGSNLVKPFLPAHVAATGMEPVRNAISPGGGAGTGVPAIHTNQGYSANAFTWGSVASGDLEIFGDYIVN